jgi:hypothetical protein
MEIDALDQKLLDAFAGKVVRKDLLQQIKGGENVPSYVLEYLLGRYCSTDDEAEIQRASRRSRKRSGSTTSARTRPTRRRRRSSATGGTASSTGSRSASSPASPSTGLRWTTSATRASTSQTSSTDATTACLRAESGRWWTSSIWLQTRPARAQAPSTSWISSPFSSPASTLTSSASTPGVHHRRVAGRADAKRRSRSRSLRHAAENALPHEAPRASSRRTTTSSSSGRAARVRATRSRSSRLTRS